jgi:GntR family transcriptional regulator
MIRGQTFRLTTHATCPKRFDFQMPTKIQKQRFQRRTGAPLHRQVHDFLLSRIVSGLYPVGSKLATEVALAAELNVSTITCRRALQDLAAEGYLTRTPRLGSIIQPVPSSTSLTGSLARLLDDVSLRRASARFEVRKSEFLIPPAEVRKVFGCADDEVFQRVVMVIRRQGAVVAHLTTWTPEGLARKIKPGDVARKSRIELLREAGVRISRVVQAVAGHPAPRELSKEIGVRPGGVTTRMTRTVFDTRGRVVEYVIAYSPWDQYQYRVILQ